MPSWAERQSAPVGGATLLSLLAMSQAVAAPQEAFQVWLRAAAEAEELRIVQWGSVDRDEDGRPGYLVAWLCDGAEKFRRWRVYEAAGERWVVEQGGAYCGGAPDMPPFEPIESPDIDVECGIHNECRMRIEPIDGRLVVTREENQALSGPYGHHIVWDHLHGTTRRRWIGYTDEGMVGRRHEGALIFVGRDLTAQPTFNRVLSGAEGYEGPHDASVSVIAVEPSYDYVHVVIRVTDDVHTAQDRLELWWVCERCSPSSPPSTGARDAIHHIGLTWSSDDGGSVTVLPPDDAPDTALPVAWRADDGAITVRFTHGQFTREDPRHLRGPSTWELPFTLVFDDFDGAGPPTRIATSDLIPDDPETYGTLERRLNHQRYYGPPDDDFVVRPLLPGESRLRAASGPQGERVDAPAPTD